MAARRRTICPARRALRRLGLALLACASGLLVGAAVAAAQPDGDGERALSSYLAMQGQFYEPTRRLYQGEGSEGEFTYLWPFSQAFAATSAIAGIPSLGAAYLPALRERAAGLAWYWNPKSKPPGYMSVSRAVGVGWKYYDDNEWSGLQLVRAYRMLGNRSLLAQAQRVFALVVFGWDGDRRHPCPGGVFWTQKPNTTPRATVSNAPGAELGLELYQLTHRSSYLQWAKRMYHWVRLCLREMNGLYADNIDLYGTVDKSIFIYNQGTMIGTEVLLYQVTGKREYLQRARESAATTMAYFTRSQLEGQAPFFVSIFGENLLRLNALSPNPAYRAYLQEYADHAWAADRDPQTGLFDFHEHEATLLLQQAAMTQLLAYLSWDSRWFATPGKGASSRPHASRARG